MLPSFYLSGDKVRLWSVTRAALYGAGIGAVAAVLKILGPLHEPFAASGRVSGLLANVAEIAGAALGFALLCVAACALRNFIAQRLI
jgi:hypothetical protein